MHFGIFLRNLLKIFEIFSKFPIICVFRPNAQKTNAGFVRFFQKYAKICIFSNFRKQLFENFTILSKFPRICVFRPNAQKINVLFVQFFPKIC